MHILLNFSKFNKMHLLVSELYRYAVYVVINATYTSGKINANI
jgi:hypothetical protein